MAVRARSRRSIGLLGQLLAILLLTMGIEFAASTLLYERSSSALVRDDEAHRLAEHLVIVRKLVSEREPAGRPALAAQLSTNRYDVHWSGTTQPLASRRGTVLDAMRHKVLEWEPELADSDLGLRMMPVGRRAMVVGEFRLADQSWIRFRAATGEDSWEIAVHRMLLALLSATLLLLIGMLLFRRTLGPMKMLARAAERIGRGGEETLPEAGPREVRRVIRAFNAMQDRIHHLISDRTQALAAVGHDLRTPLARLQLRAGSIEDPALRRAFEADSSEMGAMVDSLLAYLGGENDPEPPVRADVAVLAATLVDDAIDRGEDATYEGADHLEAMVRPVALKRALGNLVENALHYGHCVRVSVTTEDRMLLFRVEDEGPGIPEDRMEDALRPFERLDAARGRNTGGLGLGLSIVARVAEQGEGTLTLINRPEGGLRAELRLPLR
jgi:signal transduction histidine kinase